MKTKMMVEFDATACRAGTLCSSGFYAAAVREGDPRSPRVVHGMTCAADKADLLGAYIDGQKYAAQKLTLEAVLCGNYTTGTGTDEVNDMVSKLCRMLNGNYRGKMGAKTAKVVFAALTTLWTEALKEVRGGAPCDFAMALRNLADGIDRGDDVTQPNHYTTGHVPLDHYKSGYRQSASARKTAEEIERNKQARAALKESQPVE